MITDNCVYIKILNNEHAEKICKLLSSDEYTLIEETYNKSNAFRSFYTALNYIDLSKHFTAEEINYMTIQP